MSTNYFTRRRTRMNPLQKVVLVVAAAFLAICILLLGFQVTTIECEGNYLYTKEQIIAACGIEKGDNIISIHKAKSAGMILSSLPFVGAVHIERVLPGTVIISITESEACFAMNDEYEHAYLIDGTGKVAGEMTDTLLASYPMVYGMLLTNTDKGTPLAEATDSADKVSTLLELIRILDLYGVTGNVNSITLEAVNDIHFNYNGRYDVYLGSMDKIEYKVSFFADMLKNWETGRSGVIDLTFDVEENARFQPYAY